MSRSKHVFGNLWRVFLQVTMFTSLISIQCLAQTSPKAEITLGQPMRIFVLIHQGGRQWLEDLYGAFTRSHPDIIVRTHSSDPDIPMRMRAYIETQTDLPDMIVAYSGSWSVDDIPYLADEGIIIPLDNYLIGDKTFDRADIMENAWEPVTYREKIWGVPLRVESMALCCHMDAFARANVKDPPRTWNEFVEIAKKMTMDLNGDGKTDQYGFIWEPFEWRRPFSLWYTIALQKGARFTKEGRWDFSDPKLAESLRFLADLRNTYKATTDDRRTPHGMCIQWLCDGACKGGTENLRFVSLPVFDYEAYATGIMNVYVTIRRTNSRKEDACWEFAKWLCRQFCSHPAVIRVPIKKSSVADPAWRDFIAKRPGTEVYFATFKRSHPAPLLHHGADVAVKTLSRHFQAALDNRKSIEGALHDAELELNAIMRHVKTSESEFDLYK